MEKERLIEEVRKYNLLYDINDSRYNDHMKKNAAWAEISRSLGASVSTCRKMWANLREAHRRAIKKKKRLHKSGQTPAIEKKWQYEGAMSFLLPYYKERAATSTLTDSDQESGNEDTQMFAPDIQSDASIPEEKSQFESSASPLMKRIKRTEDEASETSLLMKYIEEKQKNKDEIDIFFAGIAATVKKFNDYNKAMIKSQVFNLVSQVELQEINENRNNCFSGNNFSNAAGASDSNKTNFESSQDSVQPNIEFDFIPQVSIKAEKELPEYRK